MSYTDEFFEQAQAAIMDVLRGFRPELLAAYGNVDEEMKDDNTVVTALDKKLEELLREALGRLDDSIPIVGEEHGGETNQDTFWLIDPIDGTESFVRGIPFCRNMVTLIENNKPVFALVYKPVVDDLFVAIKGRGAFKNGTQIHASNRPLRRTWVETGVSERSMKVLLALKKKINGYRQIGDFTLIAEGKVDALLMITTGGGPWDYAPRMLLLDEAGAKVTNIGSETYDFRDGDFLAANPAVFDEIMQVITEALATTKPQL